MDRKWLLIIAVALLLVVLLLALLPKEQKAQPPGPEALNATKGEKPASRPIGEKAAPQPKEEKPASRPDASKPAAPYNETAGARAGNYIKIASWNLQAFGEKKSQNATIMALYSRLMRQYDIIFIQEIRDNEGAAFPRLCSLMEGYRCLNSSRAGRSQSKEQYGIIYKGAEIIGMKDYNPDSQDRWERPPFQATFRRGNYTFITLVEHTKPEDSQKEIAALDALGSTLGGNVVALGDLNADCSYYRQGKEFGNWTWAPKTGVDTTVKNTSCTYDRMIFNPDMAKEYAASGVVSEGITPAISDHYLIWSEIAVSEG